MNYPQVIVLNGCSSSGKTALARALQELLPVQYLNFSIDSLLDGLPKSDLAALQSGLVITRSGYDFAQLVRAYHYALPGLLQAGCRLLLDNAWCDSDEKAELLTELAGYPVLLVGVDCALDELVRRETARGDRAVGQAAWEYPRVHQQMHYDLTIDTTGISPQAAAEIILQAIQAGGMWHGAINTLENLNLGV
ncbi:chloramphenicol phosphotransferase CPT family protein [Chitinibacter sp. ZOR0017]|uniref:chloramphenicol phosphotransferase CPT family protein n=1 Tax=Chitinibacter sp. ZOR0017 TaxID=1339254 RepID=UPI000648D533|nr:AAA family ATPase [Chitinibacter sp. ZOR0017]